MPQPDRNTASGLQLILAVLAAWQSGWHTSASLRCEISVRRPVGRTSPPPILRMTRSIVDITNPSLRALAPAFSLAANNFAKRRRQTRGAEAPHLHVRFEVHSPKLKERCRPTLKPTSSRNGSLCRAWLTSVPSQDRRWAAGMDAEGVVRRSPQSSGRYVHCSHRNQRCRRQ